ncbi:MAG: hypothetical protein IT331_08920 [Anaerolineae bacterium]|nr:hypothetical protein [Anaerolineae bacterium]
MSVTDADLVEKILLRQAERASGTLNILEWGSGKSTIYFTTLLEKRRRPFNWVTLEYDRLYFETTFLGHLMNRDRVFVEYVDANSRVTVLERGEPTRIHAAVFDKGKLTPFDPNHADDRLANMDDYVGFPANLNLTFDFVLVDGRHRRRCLLEAAKFLKPQGIAILHDAYREHYRCALGAFRSRRAIGDILAIAAQFETDFDDLISD